MGLGRMAVPMALKASTLELEVLIQGTWSGAQVCDRQECHTGTRGGGWRPVTRPVAILLWTYRETVGSYEMLLGREETSRFSFGKMAPAKAWRVVCKIWRQKAQLEGSSQ